MGSICKYKCRKKREKAMLTSFCSVEVPEVFLISIHSFISASVANCKGTRNPWVFPSHASGGNSALGYPQGIIKHTFASHCGCCEL